MRVLHNGINDCGSLDQQLLIKREDLEQFGTCRSPSECDQRIGRRAGVNEDRFVHFPRYTILPGEIIENRNGNLARLDRAGQHTRLLRREGFTGVGGEFRIVGTRERYQDFEKIGVG